MPENRQIRHFPAVLFLAIALYLCMGTVPLTAKPLPPVSANWEVNSPVAPDEAFRLALTVEAKVDFLSVQMEPSAKGGARFTRVPALWEGSMARGERVRVVFEATGAPGGRVSVRISGQTASNVHFSRTFTAYVPPKPPIDPLNDRQSAEDDPRPKASKTPGIHEILSD